MTLIEFGLSHQNQGTFLENKLFGECINLKIIITRKFDLVYKINIGLILEVIMFG